MKIVSILVLGSLLFLVSCATGSYEEDDGIKLGNNMFQVSYEGGKYTNTKEVNEEFLIKCAELTIKQKMHSFVVMNDSLANNGKTGTYVNRSGTPLVYSNNQFIKTGNIKIFKKGEAPQNAIDARVYLSNFEED